MEPPDGPPAHIGPEDYPFDPAAQVDQLKGLERLRGIADRKLAEHLFTLFVLAERNSNAPATSQPAPRTAVDGLRRLALRAIAGEFGAEAQELAEYFLRDEAGRERVDDESLRAFARGLRALRRASRLDQP